MTDSNAPVWRPGKYIDLLGNPVRKGDWRPAPPMSGVRTVFTTYNLKISGGTAAAASLCELAQMAFQNQEWSNVAPIAGVCLASLHTHIYRGEEKYRLSSIFSKCTDDHIRLVMNHKCIDMNPGAQALLAGDQYKRAAVEAMGYYKGGAVLDSFYSALGAACIAFNEAFVGYGVLEWNFASLVRDRLGYQRFKKVADGEWAISDWPRAESPAWDNV